MKIVRAFPPMIDEMDKAFGCKAMPGTLYCYGDTVYIPNGGDLTPQLRAHESVHSGRQLSTEGGPAGWWRKYIDDAEFRLDEEVPAHRAEYLAWCNTEPDRVRRAAAMAFIINRLSGPLYGNLLTRQAATRAVLGR